MPHVAWSSRALPHSFWPGDLTEGGVCERWLAEGVSLAPTVLLCDDATADVPTRSQMTSTRSAARGVGPALRAGEPATGMVHL